jgi:hypothetical protein
MTVTINASPTNGIVQTADGSGVIKLQSNGVTTNALAWVNFDGTASTPITPRANYNCSSVTKNTTGDYTLNFTSALSDANYVAVGFCDNNSYTSSVDAGAFVSSYSTSTKTTSSFRFETLKLVSSGTASNIGPFRGDCPQTSIVIFGN